MSALRIAVVGAGPAGIYAADIVQNQLPDARIDLFERLPAPYGLVRYGVAPDHPRIRKITEALHGVLSSPRIRLLGNVEVGTDITIEQLRAGYDGVIIATGANADARLDIPGIDLPGSFGAADFVSWYDAHPDVSRHWPLAAESIAVLGAGNVALDVARILGKHSADLESTDTPDHVLEQLAASPVRDVHLFVRRGPVDVRFSPLELRELGEQRDVDIIIDPAEVQVDEHTERMTAQFAQRRIIMRTLIEWAQRDPATQTASRRIHLHFRQSPVRLLGDEGVTGIELERTASDALGRMVGTGERVRYDVSAVYRAIGYRSGPVPGVPFDDARGVIPHVEGRVMNAAGDHVSRLYATGWIKRGPTGLIGSTKSDAAQTVGHLVADLAAGAGTQSDDDPIAELAGLADKIVDWQGWLRIDAAERRAGEERGRERTKLFERDEMTMHAAQLSESTL